MVEERRSGIRPSQDILPRNGDILYGSHIVGLLGRYSHGAEQTPQQVLEEIQEIWENQLSNGKIPSLHPRDLELELSKNRLDASDPTYEKKLSIVTEILDNTYVKDPLTGYDAKQNTGLIIGLSHLYSETTGKEANQPSVLLSYDYGNMGGTNDFGKNAIGAPDTQIAGFAITDGAAGVLANIHREELETLAASYDNAQIHMVRSGGDELMAVVTGIPEHVINKHIDDVIIPRQEEYLASAGLTKHQHSKRPNDLQSNGFGLSVGTYDLTNLGDNPAHVSLQESELRLDERKLEIGQARSGFITESQEKALRKALLKSGMSEEKASSKIAHYKEEVQQKHNQLNALLPEQSLSYTELLDRTMHHTDCPNVEDQSLPFSDVDYTAESDIIFEQIPDRMQRLTSAAIESETGKSFSVLPDEEKALFDNLIESYQSYKMRWAESDEQNSESQ